MTDDALLKESLHLLSLLNDDAICEGSHHAKKDRHTASEPCPIVSRHNVLVTAILVRNVQRKTK